MERSAHRTSDVRCRRSGSTRPSTHALNAADESFGPTLAREVPVQKHDLKVGREILRRWMVADGLWLPRASNGGARRIIDEDQQRGLYFEALRDYLEAHGCPVAYYSDRHSVCRDKDLPNRPGVRLSETY
jgi:hypothetical protein